MRVLLATGDRDLGHALSVFLEERRVVVAGVCASAHGVPDAVAETFPHVVLLDWRLGAAASPGVVQRVLSQAGTPVVVLCAPADHEQAAEAGATGVATLGDPPLTLLAALHDATGTTGGDAGSTAPRPGY